MRFILFIAFVLLVCMLATTIVIRIAADNVARFCEWITDGINAGIETVLTKIIIQNTTTND